MRYYTPIKSELSEREIVERLDEIRAWLVKTDRAYQIPLYEQLAKEAIGSIAREKDATRNQAQA